MSGVVDQHRREGATGIGCAVVTVSDTRTLETDRGGPEVCRWLESSGHQVIARHLIPDEPTEMARLVLELCERPEIAVILLTGGTGIGSRDQTFETISRLLTKPLPGYGELFRMLSFQEIGAAAMLSRAVGGLIGRVVVLTMPGSPSGVRLAMERLIIPELGHLVGQANR